MAECPPQSQACTNAQQSNGPSSGPCWQLVHAASSFSYRLPEAMIFVGREGCDVIVEARSVDKRHAVIMYDYCDKKFKVKDLNSVNGTFVNEVRIPVQTYIQLDSMDLLRFGFDSAAYQVVRVPGPSEILPIKEEILSDLVNLENQSSGLIVETSTPDVVKSANNVSSSQQTVTNVTETRNLRAVSEEPPRVPIPVTRNLSAPTALTAATSNSSLHSAFSEDSLLGDPASQQTTTAGTSPATTPGSRVPVDAVRTLGPCGPRVPDIWTNTARRTNTAPAARSAPTRNSLRRTAATISKNRPPSPVQEVSTNAHPPVQLVQVPESTPVIQAATSPVKPAPPQSNPVPQTTAVAAPVQSTPVVSSPSPQSTPIATPQLPVQPTPIVEPLLPKAAPNVNVSPTSSLPPIIPEVQSPATPSPSSSEEPPSSSSGSSSSNHPPRLPPLTSPTQPLHPMAFTVDFADSGSKRLDIGDSISKFVPRHRRNLSVSRQDEVKQRLEREVRSEAKESEARSSGGSTKASPTPQSPVAPCPLPLPALPLLRRAGYHSEGYFSSDQEEDLSTKSDLSVRKAKALDKGVRATTNLAQEKKTKPEVESKINKRLNISGDRRTFSLEENASQHFTHILGEQSVSKKSSTPRQSSLGAPPLSSPPIESPGQDSPADNVSEAGTYTIDKDSPSPDESKARSEIDLVFGVEETSVCDTRTFTRHKPIHEPTTNGHEDPVHKSGSYRGGPNWIKEWAAQVAEQQNHSPPPVDNVLPPITRSNKGRVPSPSRGAPQSPVGRPAAVVGWPPPPTEPPPTSLVVRGRHKLPSIPPTSSPLNSSDLSDNAESPVRKRLVERTCVERVTDVSLETESYLRTTESVMTAMQARMTCKSQQDTDNGDDAAVQALTSQLRAKLRVLEQKSTPVATPQAPAVRKLSGRGGRDEGRQSDSSSEAGDHKPRSKERTEASTSAPHTRYNRAFSLRRARVEAEENEKSRSKAPAPVKAPARTTTPVSVARPRKLEPSRPGAGKPPPSASAAGNFSRADGGRFSLRAGKVGAQAPIPKPPATQKARPISARKEPPKKSSGGRSNSSLNSREVEFQNWKRRKSYDPMKAAAEGKKKVEAARKAVTTNVNSFQNNNIMTQSAIVMTSHASPNSSPLNSILRSASFHGTGGMAGGSTSSHGSAATSEDEATLSADEDECPVPASPRHTRARPSPLPPHASPMRAVSQPPEQNNSHSRKSSVDETLEGARGFIRNTTPTSSVRSRGKLEALDNLVIAAIHGFSNKIKGSSHNVLSKLRALFQEDPEKATMLEEALSLLEEGEPPTSSPSKSPSKELSGTLRNLKKLEHVFTVLDEVLFGDDEDLDVEEDEELELSDLEADQLAD